MLDDSAALADAAIVRELVLSALGRKVYTRVGVNKIGIMTIGIVNKMGTVESKIAIVRFGLFADGAGTVTVWGGGRNGPPEFCRAHVFTSLEDAAAKVVEYLR